MNHPTNPNSASTRGSAPAWLWLALCAWLLVLAALRPLALPDEGRYADVGRWMLASGDWLTPRLNGMPFFHKPPLLHWLQAASFAVFGLHPWAARLVPALHAMLMVAALYVATRQLASVALARRAAVVAGTSLAFLVGGQYVNHDMMVATWISVAIWCFAAALQADGQLQALLARLGFAACALGVLSKGLIGLALPGLVLVVWVLWTRQLQRVWRLPWLSGAAVFAAIALPWFVVAQHGHPGLLGYLFGNQQLTRYTATGFNNVHPWWFYGVALALIMLPWSWLLPWAGLAHLRRTATARHTPASEASGQGAAVPRPLWTLCWVWLIAITVFFSLPASKIVGYMLPVVPPLAVLTAWAWERVLGQRRERLFGATALVGAVLGLAATLLAGQHSQQSSARDVALALACLASPTDPVLVVGGYPYDLPFYAQLPQAVRVIQDWDELRATAGDNWSRELFEAADFDPVGARVLQPLSVLASAAQQAHTWLVAPTALPATDPRLTGWRLAEAGRHWSLWESTGLALPAGSGAWASAPEASAAAAAAATSAAAASGPKGPAPTEHPGLPGCQDHGRQQR